MIVFSNTTPFISLARKYGATRVIIDERLGRRVAEYLQLSVTGTLGVLAKAKSTGLIPSFHESALAMRQQGIYMRLPIHDMAFEEGKAL